LLALESELLDETLVARSVLSLEVLEVLTTIGYELEETTT
jgi:hypothetical protein